jgi:ankyrin repeat protein
MKLRMVAWHALLAVTAGASSSPPLVERLRDLRDTLDATADKPRRALRPALETLQQSVKQCSRELIQTRDEHGLTPMHHAVITQDLDRLNALLELDLDREVEAGPLRVRPLHLSVLGGDEHAYVLRRLLEAGASPNAPDAKGTTALQAASTLNLPHVCSVLLGHGAKCERRGPHGVRALQMAGWANSAEAAEVLLRAGAQVDAEDKKKRTAAHAAAANDAAECLEVLLEHGANPERQDARGRRALHYAVRACRCHDPQCPRVRTTQLLLEAGVQVEAEDRGGWSALDVAAEHNRIAPLRQLLEHGASPNRRSSAGCPPLTLAAHAGAREAAAVLLAHGADIDARDTNGATALQAAAVGAHAPTLKLLLQSGASTAATDDVGRNAAHYAARSGSAPCLRALRRAGVDLRATTSFGWQPLHVAANHSCANAMNVLLQSGCETTRGDCVGWTPLHLATHRLGQDVGGCRCKRCLKLHERRKQCVSILLQKGADANAEDQRRATAVHLAAAHDDLEALRLLRAHGANLWSEDADGQTPLRIARHLHRPSRVVRALLLLPGDVEFEHDPEQDPFDDEESMDADRPQQADDSGDDGDDW